jgi:hypothetical protein
MQRTLICTGILGGGTALTFVAAALAAVLLPAGALVPASSGFQGGVIMKGGSGIVVPVPMPAPVNPNDVITLAPTAAP